MKKTITALAFVTTIAFSQAQNIVPQDSTFSQPSEIALNQESLIAESDNIIPKETTIPQNSLEDLKGSNLIERADSLFMKGEKDAKRHYIGYKIAGSTVLAVGILNPFCGLTMATAFSFIPPAHENLGFPNDALFQNPSYQNGYKHKAKQIKIKKVWTNFGAVVGIYAASLLLVGFIITQKI